MYNTLNHRLEDTHREGTKFWSDVRAHLDDNDHAVKSTLESLNTRLDTSIATLTKMSDIAVSTVLHLAPIKSTLESVKDRLESTVATLTKMSGIVDSSVLQLARHNSTLKSITDRLEKHSDIIHTITAHNESRDAHVLTVESELASVHGSIVTFDARIDAHLQGHRTTTDTAVSALRTDVTDIRARIIPDLCCDLLQDVDTSIKEALARLPDVQTGPSPSRPLPAAATDVPLDEIHHATAHADGHTAAGGGTRTTTTVPGEGDRTTTQTVQSPPRGSDAGTPYPTAHSVNFPSPLHGLPNRWTGVTHVTPGCGDTSTSRSCFDGPTRPSGFDDIHRSAGIHRSDDIDCNLQSEGSPLNMPPAQRDPTQRGGPIVSPRASDREQLAPDLKTSRFDMATLAHSKYHGGTTGKSELTLDFIHECGYDSITVKAPEDILICYNDIILVHRKVVAGWTNSRTGRSGPTVEYILKKALVNFPKLRALDARAAVDFYDKLQKLSAGYLLPLMPFDAIKLSFNFEGLCPPGLGTHRYAEVGSALMDILPRLLPTTSTEITSAAATVGFESNNGYDLLWRVLELTVPGFDPTVPILPPVWHRDSDMFNFCHAHLLYFRLQAKKNNYFDVRTRTSIFLRAIADSEYADIVTLLQAQVDSFRSTDGDDGYLPHHLRHSGIATLINTNAKARVRDFASPRINRAFGSSSDGASAYGSDQDWDAVDVEELPYYHVQGYTPRVCRLDQGRDRADNGRDRGRLDQGRDRADAGRDRDRYRDRDQDRGAYRGRREQDSHRDLVPRDRGPLRPGARGPHGRALRPDQRRRPFLPGVNCAACKRAGHEASNCDMLAIALFIDRHKDRLSDAQKSSIEEKWISHWKEKVGQPTRTPRLMRAYCEELDITAEHLIEAMDWECWPASNDDAFADE